MHIRLIPVILTWPQHIIIDINLCVMHIPLAVVHGNVPLHGMIEITYTYILQGNSFENDGMLNSLFFTILLLHK